MGATPEQPIVRRLVVANYCFCMHTRAGRSNLFKPYRIIAYDNVINLASKVHVNRHVDI